MWTVNVTKRFQKQLRKIDQRYCKKILDFVAALHKGKQPEGWDTLKLQGSENEYRCRVGIYRIVYEVFESEILIEVVEVAHRKDVYK